MISCSLYHDGGSGLWNDRENVFNNITSHIAFAHGNSKHTTVTDMWYNNSESPNLQVSKNDEFCIKNEELSFKNEELCI